MRHNDRPSAAPAPPRPSAMHSHDPAAWAPSHDFSSDTRAAERGTRWVLGITLAVMALEIGAGLWSNSMALLADGWHMGSHALAIGLSVFAYAAARRYAGDARFAFGTWKIEVLAGWTSAVLLLVVAGLMVVGSVERLLAPRPIRFEEAIGVAVFGLLVNLGCAWILHRAGGGHAHHRHDHGHAHDHDHGHDHAPHAAHAHHGHDHAHADLNLRAAIVHVLTDALTSVLAIAALLGGLYLGWNWLDPLMGLVGAVLVAWWARGLLRETGRVLLDREMDHPMVDAIRARVDAHDPGSETRLVDLHVWRVGHGRYAAILSVVTHDRALDPARIKALLADHAALAHVTVEVQHCPGDA